MPVFFVYSALKTVQRYIFVPVWQGRLLLYLLIFNIYYLYLPISFMRHGLHTDSIPLNRTSSCEACESNDQIGDLPRRHVKRLVAGADITQFALLDELAQAAASRTTCQAAKPLEGDTGHIFMLGEIARQQLVDTIRL